MTSGDSPKMQDVYMRETNVDTRAPVVGSMIVAAGKATAGMSEEEQAHVIAEAAFYVMCRFIANLPDATARADIIAQLSEEAGAAVQHNLDADQRGDVTH